MSGGARSSAMVLDCVKYLLGVLPRKLLACGRAADVVRRLFCQRFPHDRGCDTVVIANGVVLKVVNAVCRDRGYEPPTVCTPEELMTP